MNLSFGGTDNKLNSFENAKVVVLPVPYGRTVTYRKGTENGPRAILDASDNMELFDEELGREIHAIGINTATPADVTDLKPQDMVNIVEARVSDIIKKDKMSVVLGGEHSVTIGAVHAAKKKYSDLSILYFDAHCDLRDTYGGSRYNHACVACRLKDIASVVEVGVRSLSKGEDNFLAQAQAQAQARSDIKVITMLDMMKTLAWPDVVKKQLSKNVYISIDLDVFDPSIMPSVGTPEPGGMTWYDFLKAIRDIVSAKDIVGFDVTELCPIKDMPAPDFTAARLIYKILGYIFFPNSKK